MEEWWPSHLENSLFTIFKVLYTLTSKCLALFFITPFWLVVLLNSQCHVFWAYPMLSCFILIFFPLSEMFSNNFFLLGFLRCQDTILSLSSSIAFSFWKLVARFLFLSFICVQTCLGVVIYTYHASETQLPGASRVPLFPCPHVCRTQEFILNNTCMLEKCRLTWSFCERGRGGFLSFSFFF